MQYSNSEQQKCLVIAVVVESVPMDDKTYRHSSRHQCCLYALLLSINMNPCSAPIQVNTVLHTELYCTVLFGALQ
jgi:hypothetical protein